MRLALQTDYALRTLLYLATKPGRATVQEVSSFYGISANHLAKVVHQLGRLGYVRNVRGPSGGVALARDSAAVTVGGVVRDFEGSGIHLLDCVDTPGVCVIQPGCALRGVLAEAERRQMEYLDGITLAALVPASGEILSLTQAAPPASRMVASPDSPQTSRGSIHDDEPDAADVPGGGLVADGGRSDARQGGR